MSFLATEVLMQNRIVRRFRIFAASFDKHGNISCSTRFTAKYREN